MGRVDVVYVVMEGHVSLMSAAACCGKCLPDTKPRHVFYVSQRAAETVQV